MKHPVKENILFHFFDKKIIVFYILRIETEKMKGWLLGTRYQTCITQRDLHNARLQGLAPDPSKKKELGPSVT